MHEFLAFTTSLITAAFTAFAGILALKINDRKKASYNLISNINHVYSRLRSIRLHFVKLYERKILLQSDFKKYAFNEIDRLHEELLQEKNPTLLLQTSPQEEPSIKHFL